MVEGGKAVHVGPDLLVGGVKDMGAVLVDLNALHRFAVNVAAGVVPPVDDQTPLSPVCCLPGKHRAEQARAHD